MRPLLAVVALTSLASAGCLSHERDADVDGGVSDSGVDDAGAPPYCEPALFAEPFPPEIPPPVPPDPSAPPPRGIHFGMQCLSPRSFGGAIFLERPEPIELSIEVVHGVELIETSAWSLHFFVDAVPIDVVVGGAPIDRVDFLVDASRASVRVTIPAGVVAPGAHTLTMVVHQAFPADEPPRLFVGGAWTIFHGSYAWSDVEPTAGGRSQVATDHVSENAVLREEDGRPFFGEVDRPSDGVFSLTVGLQPSDERLGLCDPPHDRERMALIAVLDGRLHPLGAHAQLVAEVPYGRRALFDVDVEGLPTDGAPHQLELVALHGLASSMLVDPPTAWTMGTQAGASAYAAERLAMVRWDWR